MSRLLAELGCETEGTHGTITLRADGHDADARPLRHRPHDAGQHLRAGAAARQAQVRPGSRCPAAARSARPVDLHLRGLRPSVRGSSCRRRHRRDGRPPAGHDHLPRRPVRLDGARHGERDDAPPRSPRARPSSSPPPASRRSSISPTCSTRWAPGSPGPARRASSIEGVEQLGGADHRVMPDRIVAGTYAIAAAITNGEVIIDDFPLRRPAGRRRPARRRSACTSSGPTPARIRGAARSPVTRPPADAGHDHDAAVSGLPDRPPGPDDGPAVPGRRQQHHHREDLPRALHARGGADAHGCPALPRRGRRSSSRACRSSSGAGDGQRPARLGRAWCSRAWSPTARPSCSRVYHLDRGYTRMEETLNALGAQIERFNPDPPEPAAAPAPRWRSTRCRRRGRDWG